MMRAEVLLAAYQPYQTSTECPPTGVSGLQCTTTAEVVVHIACFSAFDYVERVESQL